MRRCPASFRTAMLHRRPAPRPSPARQAPMRSAETRGRNPGTILMPTAATSGLTIGITRTLIAGRRLREWHPATLVTLMRKIFAPSALLGFAAATQSALAQSTTAHEPDIGSGGGSVAGWWWVVLIVILAAVLIAVLMRAYRSDSSADTPGPGRIRARAFPRLRPRVWFPSSAPAPSMAGPALSNARPGDEDVSSAGSARKDI